MKPEEFKDALTKQITQQHIQKLNEYRKGAGFCEKEFTEEQYNDAFRLMMNRVQTHISYKEWNSFLVS